MSERLLTVSKLRTRLVTEEGVFDAVSGVSFDLAAGETLAIVGESGCGKSLTALSIMGLVPNPPGLVTEGEILHRGHNLLSLSERELEQIRGREIAMIFQEPMTALNPVLSIGEQLMEGIAFHQGLRRSEARKQATDLLRLVGIPSAETRMREFPHQLSGGMRQRVMIAIALSCKPGLLIADEPTTALDVTIQAQILRLIKSLQQQLGTALLLITHDLGVVAGMADRVLVMYLGQVVEDAAVSTIFRHPRHPYTRGLLRSMPSLTASVARLHQIEGSIPSAARRPHGCPFHPRCPHADGLCQTEPPELLALPDGSRMACWHPQEAVV